MTTVALLGWVAGWLLFIGLRRRANSPNNRLSDVSIIVPARDEEENLPRLLQSIAKQSVAPREVIVVNDCSRDQTAAVAEAWGARLVDGRPPPCGWRGKTWACHQGANAAAGDLLVFLDADTWLEPDGLSHITAQFQSGAMSIAPYHWVPTVREQFSAFFHLVMLGSAGSNTLLGQSLVIDRATYAEAGGHRAVRKRTVENFALAQRLRGAARIRTGRRVLNMRMYPRGWRELIDGWSKSFASGAAKTPPVRLALIVVWIAGCSIALSHPLTYVLSAFQIALLLRRFGNYRLITALLYPLPLLFFIAVFGRSLLQTRIGPSILWKGRPVGAV